MAQKFKVISIDPPWHYKDKASAGKRGASHKYPVMTDADIKALPIKDIAEDNCVLFIWTTFPKLNVALDVIQTWGFKYKTCAFTWIKTNKKSPSLFFGMGNWTRSNAEICLLAVKGKPKRISASVKQVIMSPIEKHSKKPDEARDRIVDLMGDVPRIEIFARQLYDGWTCIGNDIDGRDITDALDELINF